MKCFEIIFWAENMRSPCAEEPNFRYELGVILANSLEEAEEALGVKHQSPAPPFLQEMVPPVQTYEGREYQRYGSGKILLLEVPFMQRRCDLEEFVTSKKWKCSYHYHEDKS